MTEIKFTIEDRQKVLDFIKDRSIFKAKDYLMRLEEIKEVDNGKEKSVGVS